MASSSFTTISEGCLENTKTLNECGIDDKATLYSIIGIRVQTMEGQKIAIPEFTKLTTVDYVKGFIADYLNIRVPDVRLMFRGKI